MMSVNRYVLVAVVLVGSVGFNAMAESGGPHADAAKSAVEQGSSESDISITQKIRQELMSADNLSYLAKNATIVTSRGIVTLRGVVPSEKERKRIAAISGKVAGPLNVHNQLRVEAK